MRGDKNYNFCCHFVTNKDLIEHAELILYRFNYFLINVWIHDILVRLEIS